MATWFHITSENIHLDETRIYIPKQYIYTVSSQTYITTRTHILKESALAQLITTSASLFYRFIMIYSIKKMPGIRHYTKRYQKIFCQFVALYTRNFETDLLNSLFRSDFYFSRAQEYFMMFIMEKCVEETIYLVLNYWNCYKKHLVTYPSTIQAYEWIRHSKKSKN